MSFCIKRSQGESAADGSRTWNSGCVDALDAGMFGTDLMQYVLSDAVGGNEACGDTCATPGQLCIDERCVDATCDSMAAFCHEVSEAGVRARQMCSQTCRCDDPRSSLVLSLPQDGCPDGCLRANGYVKRLAEQSCDDVAASDPGWLEWVDNLENVTNTYPQAWRDLSAILVPAVREYGCTILPFFWFVDLDICVEQGTFFPVKPLSYFCPVTCGCAAGDVHCPTTCPATASRTVTASALELFLIYQDYGDLFMRVFQPDSGNSSTLDQVFEFFTSSLL